MNRLHQWRRWIRPLVMVVYLILLLVALPLMIIEFHRYQTATTVQFWFIGGMFVLLSLPISLWGILQHLVYYTEPILQRHIIRILWMVPVYAINAWFALKFPSAAIYLDSGRECYEAYVIYNFMSYLLNYLRMEHQDLESYIASKPQVAHLPPACCLPTWKMGRDLIEHCKHGVMQYTVLRPVTTLIAFVCAMAGDEYYGEGVFNFKSAWSYLIIINNISQIFAMYCLVLFYKATKDELAPIRPVAKFMCVKAVVFLSFWQSILIAVLVNTGAIAKQDYTEKGAAPLQDFCICIEMFVAAVAHYFSFSYRPFVDLAADPLDCFESFKSMWDVSDVQKDVVEHIRHVGQTASGVIKSPLTVGRPVKVVESEMTPLLSGDETQASTGAEIGSEVGEVHDQTWPQPNGVTGSAATVAKDSISTSVHPTNLGKDYDAEPLLLFDGRREAAPSNSANGTAISVKAEIHEARDNGAKPFSWDELPNTET